MPNSLTAAGLQTATRAELVAYYTEALQAIYGSDVNLDSDTPDGQWMNILIQANLDLQDLLAQIYNSFDPDNAIGNILDQRVAINGIQRQSATFTTTNITLVTTQILDLFGLDQSVQPVFTVADSTGNQWQLISTETSVPTGSNVFLFQAANPGQVFTIPDTITVPVTIILGVSSINNPTTYSTLGVNEESDMTLKIRRQKSVSLQGRGYLQGLLAALENINGVTSAFVIENTSDGVDGDGIPGHSIWVIVAGTPNINLATVWNSTTVYQYGSLASSAGINYISNKNNNLNNPVSNTNFWQVYNPIAEAIYAYRNAGCGMYNSLDAGAQSYTIVQIDNSAFTVYWDSVIEQDVFVKFTASSLNGINPPNISAIISYLVSNFTPGVYEEIDINQLATYVQLADPNTLVTLPGFSLTAGGSYTNTLTPSAKNKQFFLQAADIIVLPMIMSCPSGVQVIVSGLVTTTTVSVVNLSTIQFTALGGYGTNTFSMSSGSGSVNSSSGLYTSAGIGTDVVLVTDSQGHTATATVTVT